jgi:hypothetical protein
LSGRLVMSPIAYTFSRPRTRQYGNSR